MSYLDITDYGDDDEVQMLRDEVHRFASDELRPAADDIDRMPYEEYVDVVERPSRYWDVLEQMKELGYHNGLFPTQFGGGDLTGREIHVMWEELGWGSAGFAIALGVDAMPALFSMMSMDPELEESYVEPYLEDTAAEYHGCWAVTEPSHGSDFLQFESEYREEAGVDEVPPPETTLEETDDGWRLDGVKSSWISSGPVATHAAVHASMDPSTGSPGYVAVIPLDQDGVTVGDPIDKLGERECPQGEIRFDDVHVPDSHVAMTPEMLRPGQGASSISQVLCMTSSVMAAVSTGQARAAFEEALAYSRERRQCGRPIAEHQSVKAKLYEMFEKVETARAYSRNVCEHVIDDNLRTFEFDASPRHALAAQVYCKRTAFEVAHEALQVHGANGITRDYHVEKLFRDSRVKLIEDGTIEVLGLESAEDVIDSYSLPE